MTCKIKVLLIFLFTFFILENLWGSVTTNYEKMFKASIVTKNTPYEKFGLSLFEKNNNGEWKEVLKNNNTKPMTPASISKILTSAGLLELHGINKSIPTELYADQKPVSGVILGNLYVKGFGDPSLVSEKLWLLVNELKNWKVKKITGKLVFDDSAFDRDIMVAGRSKWNQRAYNAYISGLSLNWNSVRVRFLDIHQNLASTDPYNPYFELRVSKNIKKKSGVEIRESKNKEVISAQFGQDAVTEEKSIYRRVNSTRSVFQNQFKALLKDAGIEVVGESVWEKTSEQSFKIGDVKSRPISNLVKLMMKFSNNFIADSLVKFTYFDQTQKTGNYTDGMVLIKESLKNISEFGSGFVFTSASGLSRDNKISPQAMSKLLINLKTKYYYPEFLSSMPISCIDGTLKDRLCAKTGSVRAKTGLLAGVSALAGFARRPKDGKEFLFTFVYNGKNGQQFEARNTFDRFLEKIL